MNRREHSFAGGFSVEVGRYKNLQGLKQVKNMKEIKSNIIAISKTIRKGDRITIWHNGHQVFIKEMGVSNFNITNDLEKKEKKGLTSPKNQSKVVDMMKKLLFVGQERSKLAQERGVYWEDEAQCANQLFRALRANKINPNKCSFVNLFTDESDGVKYSNKTINKKVLNKVRRWTGEIIGMGSLVNKKLRELKIGHHHIIHPSARGSIRLKENYIRHISEKIGNLA